MTVLGRWQQVQRPWGRCMEQGGQYGWGRGSEEKVAGDEFREVMELEPRKLQDPGTVLLWCAVWGRRVVHR